MALLTAITPTLAGGTAKAAGIMDNIVGMSVSSGDGPEGQDTWAWGSVGDQFRHYLPDNGNNFVGFSFKVRSGGYSGAGDWQWMRFDASSGFENFRVGVEGTTGKIRVARNTILAGTSTTLATDNVWVRIMGWVKIATGTGGSVKLWVNDNLEIDVTGVDTSQGTTDMDKLYCGAGPGQNMYPSGGTAPRMCDIVIWDSVDNGDGFNTAPDAAPTHRTFRCTRLAPNGDSSVAFTRSAGSVNADLVNETPPDDDTTSVESATVTDQDELDVEAVPAAATSIFGVFPWAYWKEVGTARTLGINVLSGATESTPVARAGISTYKWFGGPGLGEDPDTSTQWTASGVNAAKLVYSVEA